MTCKTAFIFKIDFSTEYPKTFNVGEIIRPKVKDFMILLSWREVRLEMIDNTLKLIMGKRGKEIVNG